MDKETEEEYRSLMVSYALKLPEELHKQLKAFISKVIEKAHRAGREEVIGEIQDWVLGDKQEVNILDLATDSFTGTEILEFLQSLTKTHFDERTN